MFGFAQPLSPRLQAPPLQAPAPPSGQQMLSQQMGTMQQALAPRAPQPPQAQGTAPTPGQPSPMTLPQAWNNVKTMGQQLGFGGQPAQNPNAPQLSMQNFAQPYTAGGGAMPAMSQMPAVQPYTPGGSLGAGATAGAGADAAAGAGADAAASAGSGIGDILSLVFGL